MHAQASGVKIFWDVNVGAYRMVTPYNPAFVELLKQAMPASDRMWDATSKTWTLTEKYLDKVRALAEQCFHTTAVVVTRQQSEAASMPRTVAASPLDQIIVEFFRLLPYGAAQKAFRQAAMELHPDRGGDISKMSALNAAWQRLEKDLYGKQ